MDCFSNAITKVDRSEDEDPRDQVQNVHDDKKKFVPLFVKQKARAQSSEQGTDVHQRTNPSELIVVQY